MWETQMQVHSDVDNFLSFSLYFNRCWCTSEWPISQSRVCQGSYVPWVLPYQLCHFFRNSNSIMWSLTLVFYAYHMLGWRMALAWYVWKTDDVIRAVGSRMDACRILQAWWGWQIPKHVHYMTGKACPNLLAGVAKHNTEWTVTY